MCWILFIFKGPKSFIESINQSRSPKKNICWYGTQKLPNQNLNIYLYNYQREAAIFIATKHKKAIMACSYLNFLKIFPSFWTIGQQYYKNESIHLDSWHHSHKKQGDKLKIQVVFVDTFYLIYLIWRSRTENT